MRQDMGGLFTAVTVPGFARCQEFFTSHKISISRTLLAIVTKLSDQLLTWFSNIENFGENRL
jgi:hypothetical protein